MKSTVKLLICLLTVLAVNVQAAQEIDLKLNLQKGDKYKSTMIQDQKISQSFNGMAMDVNQHQEMSMFSEVTQVDQNGNMTIKTTYGDMKMKVTTPQMTMEFDTANPDPNLMNNPQTAAMASMYSAMKNANIDIVVSPSGETLSVEGLDQMIDQMFENMDPNMAAGMKEMIKNFISEDQVQQMSNGMYATYPEKPIQIGDVWDTIINAGGDQFPISLDSTCVLKDIKDNTALIEITAKMDMGSDGGKVIEQNGMKMNLLLTGVMSGTQQVNADTGWLTESQMQQSFSGSMKMQPNAQMPQGMTIPMSIEGKVLMKSEKIQ